jgi:predicted AAA+ superfamily ATPase
MKQLIQSLALIALFGSVSHLSLSQEVKQVQRAEKNYVDSKKIESKELQTPSASDKMITQPPVEGATPSQVTNNKNVVQTVSVGTRRAVKTPSERIKEIDDVIKSIDNKISYVREDPTEVKLAEEENWFEKMETVKKELREEKELLQKEVLKKN